MNDDRSNLIAVAAGRAPAELVIRNARIVNVFTREVEAGSVWVHGGRIAAVGPDEGRPAAGRTIDAANAYLAPGLIDAHMHVESTMLPPSEFVKLAAAHATTAIVADPHEIANVLGIRGIHWMMDNAQGMPLHFLWAVSSCVPSCHLETSGARLDATDIAPLLEDPRTVALAEMMNFPGVVFADKGVLEKVRLGRAKLVDGHSPGLRGAQLQAYLSAGISTDHECTTLEEAQEKLRRGMRISIRQGSAAQNLPALLPLITPANAHRFSFCTDDRHPGDVKHDGHIDHVVRLAVKGGLDPLIALSIASINTAQHYNQRDLGAIAPGYIADFFLFKDLKDIRPHSVYFGGQLVAEHGKYLGPSKPLGTLPGGGVTLPSGLDESSFRIAAPTGAGQPLRIRVIGMNPGQLVTSEVIAEAKITNGAIVADPARDILKLCVIERHKGGGNIGRGFISGFRFGSSGGALASTVGHDAHNLAVIGANDTDMLLAARTLEKAGGGQCVVQNGKVLAVLPLPIAGLMSDQPAEVVIDQQHKVLDAAKAIGCPLEDPFMPLSFMPLPVIPALKLSDLGLVDVLKFELVPLVV